MRRALAALLLPIASGCHVLDESPERALDRVPIVVVGSAADGPTAAEEARARAERDLCARLRAEIARRERATAASCLPAERVRDWAATDHALEQLAPSLLDRDASGLRSGRGAVYTGRVRTREYERALEAARDAGRCAPLRVACVPLALPEDASPEAVRIRELYGASLRTALDEVGITSLPVTALYDALDRVAARAERPLGARDAARACRTLGADALVHGRVRAIVGSEHVELELDLELRDGVDGRVLGRLEGRATEDSVTSLARRHALVLKFGLGIERIPTAAPER